MAQVLSFQDALLAQNEGLDGKLKESSILSSLLGSFDPDKYYTISDIAIIASDPERASIIGAEQAQSEQFWGLEVLLEMDLRLADIKGDQNRHNHIRQTQLSIKLQRLYSQLSEYPSDQGIRKEYDETALQLIKLMKGFIITRIKGKIHPTHPSFDDVYQDVIQDAVKTIIDRYNPRTFYKTNTDGRLEDGNKLLTYLGFTIRSTIIKSITSHITDGRMYESDLEEYYHNYLPFLRSLTQKLGREPQIDDITDNNSVDNRGGNKYRKMTPSQYVEFMDGIARALQKNSTSLYADDEERERPIEVQPQQLDKLMKKDMFRHLNSALGLLGDKSRYILGLYYSIPIERHTVEEASSLFGMSEDEIRIIDSSSVDARERYVLNFISGDIYPGEHSTEDIGRILNMTPQGISNNIRTSLKTLREFFIDLGYGLEYFKRLDTKIFGGLQAYATSKSII